MDRNEGRFCNIDRDSTQSRESTQQPGEFSTAGRVHNSGIQHMGIVYIKREST
jgi:hypothetical protein